MDDVAARPALQMGYATLSDAPRRHYPADVRILRRLSLAVTLVVLLPSLVAAIVVSILLASAP